MTLWNSFENNLTARHFLQLIKKLELPFSSSICVEILSKDDENIARNIERNISFIQFAEALIALIIRHKDMEISQEAIKESENVPVEGTTPTSSNGAEVEVKKCEVESKSDEDKSKLSITSIKSGSLLQTISELSEQPKNDPSNISVDEVSNIRSEVAQYIQG